jgi:uncharacterized protein DUF2795
LFAVGLRAGREGIDLIQNALGGRKGMSLGGLGDLGNLDLGQLQQYLPDVDFPASKEEVLSNLESAGAPQEMVDQVKNAGTETYNSAEEVLQSVRGQ